MRRYTSRLGLLCLFALLVSALVPIQIAAAAQWTWVAPLPQANPLLAVTYGNGQFVAVGAGGAVVSSTDGLKWNVVQTGIQSMLSGVTYGNGIFVAVGREGFIITSPDGTTWTRRESPTRAYLFNAVYGNGRFVAIDAAGGTLSSADGIAWTRTDQQLKGRSFDGGGEFSVPLQAITFGNGQFAAMSAFGTLLTSTDGTTWSQRCTRTFADCETSFGPRSVLILAGAYLDDEPVFVGSQRGEQGMIYVNTRSSFGIKDFASALQQVISVNGQLVAVGVKGKIARSTDGVNWSTTNNTATDDLWGITYGGGRYVAVGTNGQIVTSTDAVTWTSVTSGSRASLLSAALVHGRVVAVSGDGSVITSDNGQVWTRIQTASTRALRKVTQGGGILVAVGDRGTIVISRDGGASWEAVSSGVSTTLQDVAYVHDAFIAVGDGGTLLRSVDGRAWNRTVVATTENLSGIAAGSGKVLVVGPYGQVLTSVDGETWAAQPLEKADPSNIAYGNGRFVAGGYKTGLISADGVNWERAAQGSPLSDAHLLLFHEGKFVLSAGEKVFTSADGNSWVELDFPFAGGITAMLSLKGTTYAFGHSGSILTLAPEQVTVVESSIKLALAGQPVNIDVIEGNSRSLVPLRAISDLLGGTDIEWLPETNQVRLTQDGKVVLLTIGSQVATLDGQYVALDVPAVLHNERTYVPLRFVGEALGLKVEWDGANNTIQLKRP